MNVLFSSICKGFSIVVFFNTFALSQVMRCSGSSWRILVKISFCWFTWVYLSLYQHPNNHLWISVCIWLYWLLDFCLLISQQYTISKAQDYHNYLYRLVMLSISWSPVKVSQLPLGCRYPFTQQSCPVLLKWLSTALIAIAGGLFQERTHSFLES